MILSVYLLLSTPLSEFFKLPTLIEHYGETKKKNKDITILGFLEMHYTHGNAKDDDNEKDMKLPFKSTFSSSMLSLSFFTSISFFKIIPKIQFKQKGKKLPHYICNYCGVFLSSVWQPPRTC
jgi:hypothetical protein